MLDYAVMFPKFLSSCLLPQVRKFRTLTELILDAQEHVKNPYKGKKLKVSYQEEKLASGKRGLKDRWHLTPLSCVPETPGFSKETSHPLLPLLHGEAGQVREAPPGDEQPGPD